MPDPRTDAILASIDGALADDDLRDGMRWSPQPEQVTDAPEPFDGSLVWQPPQMYEDTPRAPQSHAQPPGTRLPPGASMLLAQLRADRAELLAERANLIAGGVHPSALVEPLDPDGFEIEEPETIEVARLDGTVQVIEVGERDSGLVVVAHLEPGQVGEMVDRILDALVQAIRPIIAEIGQTFERVGTVLRDAGLIPKPRPLLDLDSEEARRTFALEYRRALSTGPPPLGPERSPRPRRHLR